MKVVRDASPDPWGSKTATSSEDVPLMGCEVCECVYNGDCPKHPFEHARHVPAPLGDEQRPIKTLPDVLYIAPSAMKPHKCGVYTSEALPPRIVFGPYEGVRIDDTTKTSSYTWQLPGTGKPVDVDSLGKWGDGIPYLVDGRPLGQSNWMRYVQAAQYEEEQNLAAFIGYDGHIYYRTRQAIASGEELLVRRPGPFGWQPWFVTRPPEEEDVIPDGVVLCAACNKLRLGSDRYCDECAEQREKRDCRRSNTPVERLEAAVHQRTDIDEKPFSCQLCDKRFGTRNGLSAHGRVHVKRGQSEDFHEESSLKLPAPMRSPSPEAVPGAGTCGARCPTQRDGLQEHQVLKQPNDRPGFKSENDQGLTRATVACTHNKAVHAEPKVKPPANPNSQQRVLRCGGLRKGLVTKSVDCGSRSDRGQKSSSTVGSIGYAKSNASSTGSRQRRSGCQVGQQLNSRPGSTSEGDQRLNNTGIARMQKSIPSRIKVKKNHSKEPIKVIPKSQRCFVEHGGLEKLQVTKCVSPSFRIKRSPNSSSSTSTCSPNSSASSTSCRKSPRHSAKRQTLPSLPLASTDDMQSPAQCSGPRKSQVVLLQQSSRPDSNSEVDRRLTRMGAANMHEKHVNAAASGIAWRDGLRKRQVTKDVDSSTSSVRSRSSSGSSWASGVSSCGSRSSRASSTSSSRNLSSNAKRHMSPKCSSHVPRRDHFKRHMVNSQENKLHSCRVCGKRFGRSDHVRRHERVVHASVKPCTNSDSPQHLTRSRHASSRQQVSGTDSRPCDQSFDGVASRSGIAGTGPKLHACPKCGRCFSRLDHLQRHVEIHTGNKPYSCNICHAQFSRKDKAKRHELVHRNVKHSASLDCRRHLAGRGHLSTGQLVSRTDSGLRSQSFSSVSSQESWDSLGSGPKMHKCPECQSQFSRRDHLKRHMERHKASKPHACPLCGQHFFRADGLKRHLAIHGGEKPHACKQCGKRFSRTDHLQQHAATHENDKAHPCSVCGKRFVRKHHAKKHIATHTR